MSICEAGEGYGKYWGIALRGVTLGGLYGTAALNEGHFQHGHLFNTTMNSL
jgi:hypothetical protein